ncbi:Rdx family-domain-containing protein [Hypoxylon cercidicola]|nr:Rdx family-domain-containing protein [Hypoxylon cercidicola]
MAETETNKTSSVPASPDSPFPLPRVTIRFCTQCKWMLRAAYFAQELLSTFSTSLGEVALQPSTGGTFVVSISFPDPNSSSSPASPSIQNRVLWDRKTDGGFPETKELKRRVRDAIEPGRDLGHVDRHYPSSSSSSKKTGEEPPPPQATGTQTGGSEKGEDENALGLHTQPVAIGGPACSTPGTESTRVNAATQQECEDCK